MMDKDYPITVGWLRPGVIIKNRRLNDGYFILNVRDHYIFGSGVIAEHRLVMIEKLGRKLRRGEIVHHSEFKRTTYNHPDNLEVLTADASRKKLTASQLKRWRKTKRERRREP